VVGAYVVARRRKCDALRYSSIRLIQAAMDTRSRIRSHIPALFLLGAVVCSLIAVARPAAIVTAPSYERTIVLLTDGADTGGMPTDMAAKFAAERGVRVYTVGFGRPGAARTHARQVEETGFDESALKQIARSTRGEYFPAATAQELNHIYRELRSRIVLRKTGMELSALFAAVAALLVMIAGGLSLVWSGPTVTE
jgi:hypothetical protein